MGRGSSKLSGGGGPFYPGGNNPLQIGGDDSYSYQFLAEKRAFFENETGYSGQKAIDSYDLIDKYMGGVKADRAKIKNSQMDAIIDDMGKYKGVAYRGIALSDRQLAQYKDGAEIPLKNVSSWSSKESVATDWANASVYNASHEGRSAPNQVVLVMPKASKGARAGYMSIHGEAEVLYKSTQKIKVKNRTVKNGVYYIEVVEI